MSIEEREAVACILRGSYNVFFCNLAHKFS